MLVDETVRESMMFMNLKIWLKSFQSPGHMDTWDTWTLGFWRPDDKQKFFFSPF